MLTTSQDWWPPTTGTMAAVHPAGLAQRRHLSHRRRSRGSSDGTSACAAHSWADNANLDKARRLLWPIS